MSDAQVKFYQHKLPALPTGEFDLEAQQVIEADGIDQSLHNKVRLKVVGARYRLSDTAVAAAYPPPNHEGDFTGVMPHVMLQDVTLPWQRDSGASASANGDRTPWMALFLFTEDEQARFAFKSVKRVDFGKAGPDILDTTQLAIADEPAVSLGAEFPVIDIKLDLFGQIAPAAADLPWLGHVRETAAGRLSQPTLREAPRSQDYAFIVCNRTPTAGKRHTVVLACLENAAAYLPTADGEPADAVAKHFDAAVKPNKWDRDTTTKSIRLAVLHQWSFVQEPVRNETFVGLLEQLDAGPLRLPDSLAAEGDSAEAVRTAFAMGYTALPHRLRDGSRTVSWYRGPLTPHRTAVTQGMQSPNADGLLRLDSATGFLDVSYAAAWQRGRLLVLHDKTASTALYRWKHNTIHKALAAAQISRLAQARGAAFKAGAAWSSGTGRIHDISIQALKRGVGALHALKRGR